MQKSLNLATLALLATVAVTPLKAQPAPVGVGSRISLNATVESVDQATRQAVLRAPDGGLLTLQIGPSVRNLPQVRAGDQVVVKYERAVTAAISTPDGGAPVMGGGVAGRAAPGERPGAGAARMVRVRVRFDAASPTGDSASVTGPHGNVVSLPINAPAMQEFVRGLRAGQMVDVVYAEAIAVEVQRARR